MATNLSVLDKSISGGSIDLGSRSKQGSPKLNESSLAKGHLEIPFDLVTGKGVQSKEFAMGKHIRVSEGISSFTRVINREAETVLTKLDTSSM